VHLWRNVQIELAKSINGSKVEGGFENGQKLRECVPVHQVKAAVEKTWVHVEENSENIGDESPVIRDARVRIVQEKHIRQKTNIEIIRVEEPGVHFFDDHKNRKDYVCAQEFDS
jgi:hypothetical protein